jgi:hypothetical protein
MNSTFITFSSHGNYINAGKRLLQQAKDLNIFKEHILYTSEHLKTYNDFWKNHGDFITKNKRGYGYWIWKPYLVKKTMDILKDGDILLYLDCGCELDPNKKKEVLKCMEIVKKDKLIGSLTYKEGAWNKMDVIEKLDMNKEEYLTTKQRQAGAVFYLVCPETRKLVNEWYTLACNYHNIDDSPSISKNLPGFKEHRHDQSIFSLLTKKKKLFSKHVINAAVNIVRNKTAVSKILTENNLS